MNSSPVNVHEAKRLATTRTKHDKKSESPHLSERVGHAGYGQCGTTQPIENSDNPDVKKSEISDEELSDASGEECYFWDPREAQQCLEAAANGNQQAQDMLMRARAENKLPPDLCAVMDKLLSK